MKENKNIRKSLVTMLIFDQNLLTLSHILMHKIKKLVHVLKLLKSQSIADLIFDDFLLIDEKVYKKQRKKFFKGEDEDNT